MRYLIIDEHSTRADLEEAIGNLRARQRVCRVGSIRDELDADISELLDMLIALGGTG